MDREREREVGADPAERRAALEERLDHEQVAARADHDANEDADGERERVPRARDVRLRDRPGAGGHEQRREHAEADEVAEGEVDRPGQAEDERLPDRDEAVRRPPRGR